MKDTYIYIQTFDDGDIRYGITNNIERRMLEHQKTFGDTFTWDLMVDRPVSRSVACTIEALLIQKAFDDDIPCKNNHVENKRYLFKNKEYLDSCPICEDIGCNIDSSYIDGLISEHKDKRAAQKKAYYEANKEKVAAQKKAYYEANKEKKKAQHKAYWEANKEKRAAQQKAYKEANKDKVAARMKAYYEANKEKVAAQNKAYYEANKEKKKAQHKAYWEANKDKINAKKRIRRQLKKHGIPYTKFTPIIIEKGGVIKCLL